MSITKYSHATARAIRKRRLALGMSQQELADGVGVKRAQIKRIEGVEVHAVDPGLLQRIDILLARGARLGREKAERKKGISKKKATKLSARKKPSRRKSPYSREARDLRALLKRKGLLDLKLGELLERGGWLG